MGAMTVTKQQPTIGFMSKNGDMLVNKTKSRFESADKTMAARYVYGENGDFTVRLDLAVGDMRDISIDPPLGGEIKNRKTLETIRVLKELGYVSLSEFALRLKELAKPSNLILVYDLRTSAQHLTLIIKFRAVETIVPDGHVEAANSVLVEFENLVLKFDKISL